MTRKDMELQTRRHLIIEIVENFERWRIVAVYEIRIREKFKSWILRNFVLTDDKMKLLRFNDYKQDIVVKIYFGKRWIDTAIFNRTYLYLKITKYVRDDSNQQQRIVKAV